MLGPKIFVLGKRDGLHWAHILIVEKEEDKDEEAISQTNPILQPLPNPNTIIVLNNFKW